MIEAGQDRSQSLKSTGPIADINSLITFPDHLVGGINRHNILINGAIFGSLIDTGSQVSLLNETMYRRFFNYIPLTDIGSFLKVKAVSGEQLKYIGAVDLFIHLGQNIPQGG